MNAADPKAVREIERDEKLRRRQELQDVAKALSTYEGRRHYWRLITQCRSFESIWESSARIHYNAGQQDFGHFLMAEAMEADQEAYLLMQREAIQRKQGDNDHGR